MILLHDMQGEEFFVNPDRIESMSARPDTVLFLVNGKRMVVKDTPEQVIEGILAFRRRILSGLPPIYGPDEFKRLPVSGE
ncbi:MAG: flagellar FlbD family protein [Eubacteriales bacterium]|nr:flagellar FlbD family protein [Eubacteriales bacterium]